MTPQQFMKDRLVLLASAAVLLGVVLIVLAETLHWEWTKMFGAGLITAGGVGLGVEFALSGPRNWSIVDKLKSARLPVSYLIIAFTTLPVVIVLLAGLVGLFGDMGDASAAGVAGGVLIVTFMAVATLAAIAMTVRSIHLAFRKSPVGSAAEDTLEQPREGDAS
jgi:hypothetical protein